MERRISRLVQAQEERFLLVSSFSVLQHLVSYPAQAAKSVESDGAQEPERGALCATSAATSFSVRRVMERVIIQCNITEQNNATLRLRPPTAADLIADSRRLTLPVQPHHAGQFSTSSSRCFSAITDPFDCALSLFALSVVVELLPKVAAEMGVLGGF